MAQIWTRDEVIYRLAEAAETLRRLPMVRGYPSVKMTAWPDVVRDTIDAYGYGRPRLRPAAPAPDAIARLDDALAWLLWLERFPRQITWSRALRISWRDLEDETGLSDKTLQKRYDGALATILERLNRSPEKNSWQTSRKSA